MIIQINLLAFHLCQTFIFSPFLSLRENLFYFILRDNHSPLRLCAFARPLHPFIFSSNRDRSQKFFILFWATIIRFESLRLCATIIPICVFASLRDLSPLHHILKQRQERETYFLHNNHPPLRLCATFSICVFASLRDTHLTPPTPN